MSQMDFRLGMLRIFNGFKEPVEHTASKTQENMRAEIRKI